MSIRPVDMQLTMPRAVESSRSGAHDNQRPGVENQQHALQTQKNVQQQQQTVIQSNKSEGQNVNKDGKGNSGGYRRNRRQGQGQGQPPAGDERLVEKKSLLDISL